jgi:O-antigen/teichoic acid export membrane protein
LGIIIRQSVRSTVVSYIGVALGFIVTIWLYPRILTAEEYGLTRVIISLAAVSSQFAKLGIDNTIIRYFPYFNDEAKDHHGFLFLILIIPLTGFLLLAIVLLAGQDFIIQYFEEHSGLLVNYYLLLLPMVLFSLFFNVLTNFIKVLQNIVAATFLNEVFARILVVISLALYFVGWINFQQFMILFVLNYGVILVMLTIYLFRNYKVSLRPDFYFLNKPLLKNIAQYGLFAFMGGVASIAVANIDIIMLSALAGLEDTGIYAIAFYVGSAITISRKSIYNISSPIIADAFKEKDYALIDDIYKRSSLNQLIGGGLLFCGILANLDNLMRLLPPEYAGGSIVIILIASAYLFDMTTGLNGAIILNSERYRFDLYSTLFLIAVTITLNYLLIPDYGILGAAIGTATAIFLYNLMKVIFVAVFFDMQPFKVSMAAVILIGATVLLMSSQVGLMLNVYVDLLVRSALICLLYIGAVLMTNISDDFNGMVFGIWNKYKKYIF